MYTCMYKIHDIDINNMSYSNALQLVVIVMTCISLGVHFKYSLISYTKFRINFV